MTEIELAAKKYAASFDGPERLRIAAFIAGANYQRQVALGWELERGKVSVHGTSNCLNCDTGRITLYAASRWCVECLNKKQETNGVSEK